MDLSNMHHIAIIVSDYEKSKEFYVEKLGFPIIRENYRPERGDWKLDLKFGNAELEIFSRPTAPERPGWPRGQEARGLRHLAFHVENIEEVVAELEAKGIFCEPIRLDEFTHEKMTFFKDPDGLPLELHE